MTMDPAHGTIGGEEADQRDVQKNNFADLGGDSQPHQEPRRVNNDPRANKQKGNQPRRDRRDVHGWVVLDKPIGMTSTQAVAVLKRLFNAKRAGHAGTLDPLASGGLPIALGEATKTVPFVMDGRKRYRFTVCWGEERDTDDIEGRVDRDLRPAPDPGGHRGPAAPLHRGDRADPAALFRDQGPGRARLRPRPRRRGRGTGAPSRSKFTI